MLRYLTAASTRKFDFGALKMGKIAVTDERWIPGKCLERLA